MERHARNSLEFSVNLRDKALQHKCWRKRHAWTTISSLHAFDCAGQLAPVSAQISHTSAEGESEILDAVGFVYQKHFHMLMLRR